MMSNVMTNNKNAEPALLQTQASCPRFRACDMSREAILLVLSLTGSVPPSLLVAVKGMKTRAQADFLRLLACNEMQGYYFNKPIVPDKFAETLSHRALPQ